MADPITPAWPGYETRLRYPLLFLLGVLAALGQAPFGLWAAFLVATAGGFAALARTSTIVEAFRVGWAMGAGYFALVLAWIVEPFFVDLPRHGWMAPFAMILCAGGFGLFWGWSFAVARWLAPTARALWLVFPLSFVAFEFVRGFAFTGFPWALAAYIWAETPVMQWAAFVGPYGLGLLTLLTVTLPFTQLGRSFLRRALALAGPIILLFGVGILRLAGAVEGIPNDRPVLRLVQPNAPQHLKWHPDHVWTFFDRALALSVPLDGVRPALVIWPETSIPTILERSDPLFAEIMARTANIPAVAGLRRTEGRRYFNSLAVFDESGVTDLYDKHHLVPFGEFVPFGAVLEKIGIRGLASEEGGGYSRGEGALLLDFGPLGIALPLICYEASFTQDIFAAPSRPDWLLQITNDAWFGTWSGPYQHLAQARFRAVEQGLPLVRVANTGISGLVDPWGRLRTSLSLGVAGAVDVVLPLPQGPTPYSKTGDSSLAIIVFMSLASLALRRRAE